MIHTDNIYIATRFDVQLLEVAESSVDMTVGIIDRESIKALNPISLIRDKDTAEVISDELGFNIEANAKNITFKQGDTVIVPIFVAGLNSDDTVSFPYVAIDHFIRIDIMPF